VRSQRARGVVVPILGARRRSQIEDNLGALAIELTTDELDRLERLTPRGARLPA
jgi:aryl-alcohol dehydrogenase-like predicted oxidoreductase